MKTILIAGLALGSCLAAQPAQKECVSLETISISLPVVAASAKRYIDETGVDASCLTSSQLEAMSESERFQVIMMEEKQNSAKGAPTSLFVSRVQGRHNLCAKYFLWRVYMGKKILIALGVLAFAILEIILTLTVVFAPFAYMSIALVIIAVVFFVVLKKKPGEEQVDSVEKLHKY